MTVPSLPKTLKVAAFDIVVEEWHPHAATGEQKYGIFSSYTMTIKVDCSVPTCKVLDTFLHEIFHAIYWAYSIEDEDKEERIVNCLGTAWAQVLRDNPLLVEWLSAVTSGPFTRPSVN